MNNRYETIVAIYRLIVMWAGTTINVLFGSADGMFLTLLSITVALFAYYTEHNGILSSASVSVFVEGVLLIVGKMLKGQNEIPAMTENQV